MSSSSPAIDPAASTAARELAAQLVAVVERGGGISDDAIQELLAALTRLYGARVADGSRLRAYRADGQVTATDCMQTVTGMLHAVNVQLFELGMWQAWSGANALHRGERV